MKVIGGVPSEKIIVYVVPGILFETLIIGNVNVNGEQPCGLAGVRIPGEAGWLPIKTL